MTEPAVLQATYSDFKYIKTRKVISLSFEIPVEHDKIVQDVLGGMPRPEAEKWVAIAVMNPELVTGRPEKSAENHSDEKGVDTNSAKSSTKGPHGDYANALYKCRFMRNLKVCEALGTDEEFRKWIQRQPSCISGERDYIHGDGPDGEKCEAAHVRRAATSGTGYKAPYTCVPLTHAEHLLQHQKGEAAALEAKYGSPMNATAAKEWFDKRAIEYREKWVHERLCEAFEVKSLTDIDPQDLRVWAILSDLEHLLPGE